MVIVIAAAVLVVVIVVFVVPIVIVVVMIMIMIAVVIVAVLFPPVIPVSRRVGVEDAARTRIAHRRRIRAGYAVAQAGTQRLPGRERILQSPRGGRIHGARAAQERGVFAIEPIEDIHFIRTHAALLGVRPHAAHLLARLPQEGPALGESQPTGIAIGKGRAGALTEHGGIHRERVIGSGLVRTTGEERGQAEQEQGESFHKHQGNSMSQAATPPTLPETNPTERKQIADSPRTAFHDP